MHEIDNNTKANTCPNRFFAHTEKNDKVCANLHTFSSHTGKTNRYKKNAYQTRTLVWYHD